MASERQIQGAVDKLVKSLKDLSESMNSFPEHMRGLYNRNSFGLHSTEKKLFNQLRDETWKNTMIYVTILPSFELTLKSMISLLRVYKEKLYDQERLAKLRDIATELEAAKERSFFLRYLHEKTAISFEKKMEDIFHIFNNPRSEELCKNDKIKEEQDWNKSVWKRVMKYIQWPLVGFSTSFCFVHYFKFCSSIQVEILVSMLMMFAWRLSFPRVKGVFGNSVNTDCKNLNRMRDTVDIVSGQLKKFRDGFCNVIDDCITIVDKVQKVSDQELEAYMEDFEEDLKNAIKICRITIEIMPNFKSSLDSIPTTVTEKMYVTKWVKEMKRSFVLLHPDRKITSERVLKECSLTIKNYEVNVGY